MYRSVDSMGDTFNLKAVFDAVNDIEQVNSKKKETVTPVSDAHLVRELVTQHTKCPVCGGGVSRKIRSETKEPMTVYTDGEVRHLHHVESRCVEEHCK